MDYGWSPRLYLYCQNDCKAINGAGVLIYASSILLFNKKKINCCPEFPEITHPGVTQDNT